MATKRSSRQPSRYAGMHARRADMFNRYNPDLVRRRQQAEQEHQTRPEADPRRKEA